jgi:hypothetical protein
MPVSCDRESVRVEGTPRALCEYISSLSRVHVVKKGTDPMSLLTFMAIIQDYMPYERSAKTFSPVEDKIDTARILFPPSPRERPRDVDSRHEPCCL